MVNGAPVFGGEVVKEGLGRVRHTSPCGGLGTTFGQFGTGNFGIAVTIAEAPEWIPVGAWDLKLSVIFVGHFLKTYSIDC